ncbi:hypothetical protein [Streptomyces agglomeratus]|nr:hypothetical protein [Streptomyces agglomeratus]
MPLHVPAIAPATHAAVPDVTRPAVRAGALPRRRFVPAAEVHPA